MTYEICSRKYPVIGFVDTQEQGRVPLVDLPQITDEKWHELARENAVQNFTQEFGYPPESTEKAVDWQRERVGQIVWECEAAV